MIESDEARKSRPSAPRPRLFGTARVWAPQERHHRHPPHPTLHTSASVSPRQSPVAAPDVAAPPSQPAVATDPLLSASTRLRAQRSAAERFAVAVRGPLAGLAVNLVLVVVKAVAGIVSGSAALLADAGHSGADLANNVLVLASLFYSRRPADETHPYGHDRAEVLAAMASSFVLAAAALFFGWDSIQKLIVGVPSPTPLALYVAVGAVVIKLVVVRFESGIATAVTSQAVLADARDNLSDVFSSLAVIIGVIGARLGYPKLDGAAGIVIALLILYTAIRIGGAASHEVLDHNLDQVLLNRVRAAAVALPEVQSIAAVTGRAHGSDVLVELSVQVDPTMTISQASALAEQIRYAIYDAVPEVGDAVVEFNTDHLARLWDRLR